MVSIIIMFIKNMRKKYYFKVIWKANIVEFLD